jgi:hypothetical protein
MPIVISKLLVWHSLFVPLLLLTAFARQADSADTATSLHDHLEPADSLFAGVQDRTRGIRDAEREAYFRVLEFAEQKDNNRLREAAQQNLADFENQFYVAQQKAAAKNPGQPHYRFSLYAGLLNDPAAYRGKLLTLRGHIRRLEEMPLMDGDRDLGTAYQAYLFTDDSRTHPYIVVCRFVPPEMPRGGDIAEEVEVTGYFFKIYAYDAQDTARVAPLIIAQRLNWFPHQANLPLISPLLGGVLAAAAILMLIVVLWRISAKDRRIRETRLWKLAEETESFSLPEQ